MPNTFISSLVADAGIQRKHAIAQPAHLIQFISHNRWNIVAAMLGSLAGLLVILAG